MEYFFNRDTLDAHSEGKAGVYIRVDARAAKDIRMNHARAEYLDPALALAHLAALAAAHKAGDVYLGGRLGKREMVRTEADARILAEHSAGEGLERSLEVAHGDVLVNDKSLKLMEHRRMRSIRSVASEASSR